MCIKVELSENERDLIAKHKKLGAECWVWHKSLTTMRVTLWTSVPGQSRMFDITKKGIRECRD